MKSTVTKLYDWHKASVPEELRKWHVDADAVQKKLAELANTHAVERCVDTVQTGDSVRLRCTDGTLAERTVLLYPGLQLPAAGEAEQAVLGKKAGQTLAASIGGSLQTMTVEEIRRRTPAAIDDALVQAEEIEGVNTLEEYGRWYQEQTEEENKEQAKKEIAFTILEQIVAESEYALDREEVDAWTAQRAREIFDEMVAMGEDPHIPEDGLELLSDEEALARLQEDAEGMFKANLATQTICNTMGISTAWEDVREDFEQMVPPEEDMPEEERSRMKAMFMENIAATKALERIMAEADAYLED